MASVLPAINHSLGNANRYLVVAPDGKEIEVPKEMFAALSDFMTMRKDAGSMIVHFRNGGVAGLETLVKKKYK